MGERNGKATSAHPVACPGPVTLLYPAKAAQVLSSPGRLAVGPASPAMGKVPYTPSVVAPSGRCTPRLSACWEGVAGLPASLPVGPALAPTHPHTLPSLVHMQHGVSVCVILFVFISVIPYCLHNCCQTVA